MEKDELELKQWEIKRSYNKMGESLLKAAFASDREGLLKALRSGAIVNARDHDGWTALMYAAGSSALFDCVDELLKAGALPNEIDGAQDSAMKIATQIGNAEVLKSLIDHGARLEWLDNHDRTVLSIAASKGDANCVALLLKEGALANNGRGKRKNAINVCGGISGRWGSVHGAVDKSGGEHKRANEEWLYCSAFRYGCGKDAGAKTRNIFRRRFEGKKEKGRLGKNSATRRALK